LSRQAAEELTTSCGCGMSRSRRQIGELGRDLFLVHAFAFAPNGRFLWTGSAKQVARLGGPCVFRQIGGVFYGWANRRLRKLRPVHISGRGCLLWEVASPQMVRQFRVDEYDYANCRDLSPDGQYVAIGTGGRDEPGAPYTNCFVRVWHASTGREIARFAHEYPVTALAFSVRDGILVAGGLPRRNTHLETA
jgi:hypothetical protein